MNDDCVNLNENIIEENIDGAKQELVEYTKKSLRCDISLTENILNILIHTSAYMGLVAGSSMYVITLLLGLTPNIALIIAFSLITFSVYTIDKLTGFHEDFINHIDRSFFIRRYKEYMVSSAIISYLMAIVIIFPLGYTAILLALTPIIGGLLYGTDWIPSYVTRKYGRLKEVFLLKNIFIAATWVITSIGLCVIYGKMPINLTVLSVSAFIGLKVFTNTIVFDMRDIEGDQRKNIWTLPAKFGIDSTKKAIMLMNIMMGAFVVIAVSLRWMPKIALFIGLITIYTHWYLTKIGKINMKFLCDVIVEGEDIVMAILAFTGILLLN